MADDHAVLTDYDLNSSAGVTILELAPASGGGPRVVYQSPPNERLCGRPHDPRRPATASGAA